MKKTGRCEHLESLLPLHAAGRLDAAAWAEVDAHLAGCATCRADLELWSAVAAEILSNSRRAVPAPDLPDRALARARGQAISARGGLSAAFRRTWELLRAQFFLVKHEMWPVSAAVMLIGAAVALLSGYAEAVYFIAPPAAAASLAALFGPEHDPAYELVMSTPTSPWRVMLARLSIVSAYNLLLALAASLALLAILPAGMLGSIILGWLCPMAFLSALALLLSIRFGTGNAIALAYGLWIANYIPFQFFTGPGGSPVWEGILLTYRSFWGNSLLLLSLSVLLTLAALWSSGRPAFRLDRDSA
jgi:hypothetical protein